MVPRPRAGVAADVAAASGMDQRVEPRSWPSEDPYRQVHDGWFANSNSEEWLYKPASNTFFHTPSETLWKRSQVHALSPFVRIDLDGLQDMAVSALFVMAAGGRPLLRACFVSWREQVAKFDDMEKDLADGCQEARMPVRPRVSAPRTCERWEAPAPGGPPGLFSWLLGGYGSAAVSAPTPATANPTMALTPGALVRHNLRCAAGSSQRAAHFAIGESRKDPEAIAMIHKDRAREWRQWVLDGQNPIDDVYMITVGDRVFFPGGGSSGVVSRAVATDQYEVSVDGEPVLSKKGVPRVFSAHELVPEGAAEIDVLTNRTA